MDRDALLAMKMIKVFVSARRGKPNAAVQSLEVSIKPE
jgi:hypothetical protein